MTTNPVSPQGSSEAAPAPGRSWLHWGIIVGGLYLAMLVAITLPVICACFPSSAAKGDIPYEVYATWQYWVLIAVLLLSQLLLLRVPVRLTMKRPIARSAVWLPIAVSGFWLACLVIGLGAAILELGKIDGSVYPWTVLSVAALTWIGWAIVFIRITRSKDPKDVVKQQSGWLLKGSILELLVAVPSHIVARGRTDCCAGLFTFFGITMGISVMLLSFGPAVFLLYYARWKRLKKAS